RNARTKQACVDLPSFRSHIRHMDFDISPILEHWVYKPGQVVVRKFKGKDGKEKIQLRVDLGLLQMNAEGRPDGKRPFGHNSLFDYYQAKLHKYLAAHAGSDEGLRSGHRADRGRHREHQGILPRTFARGSQRTKRRVVFIANVAGGNSRQPPAVAAGKIGTGVE